MFSFFTNKKLPVFTVFLVFFLASLIVRGSDIEKDKEEYIRVVRNPKKQVTALETAVVHFKSDAPANKANGVNEEDSPTVDLIGAVHVGDREYYETLNDLFTKYDVVLYELVTGDPESIPSPETIRKHADREKNPVAAMQGNMAKSLKLEHQLHYINYKKKNMVHADMSDEQLHKRMFEDGEFGKLIGRAFLDSLARNDKNAKTQGRMFASLFAKDKSLAIKRAMAMEISEEIESQLYILDGKGSTLIAERNAIALEKVREQMDQGKKKIAVFYGAAHLYDFAKRLDRDFNMKPTRITWIKAWDMTK